MHRQPNSRGSRRHKEPVLAQGKVLEVLPNAIFAIELENGQKVRAHIPGSVRTRMIRVLPGDRVSLELSPYDPSRARIVQRLK